MTAPATPTVEAMCRAWWDRHANIKWDDCPEAWKPFYRESMEAALASVGLGSMAMPEPPPATGT